MPIRSIYLTPKPIYLTSQNQSLRLATLNPLSLVNLSLIFFNSNVNLTINFYNQTGKLINSITIQQSVTLKLKNADYSMITWNDTNNYNVYGYIQEILPQSTEEYEQLLSDFELNLVPVGNVIITSPLDANGNVKVDLESENVTEFTSLPYSVPANGRIVFQVEGSGSTATISFNNGSTTYQLNSGSTLGNGAIYEFSVAVAQGDVFTISGATFIRGFFIQEVLV